MKDSSQGALTQSPKITGRSLLVEILGGGSHEA